MITGEYAVFDAFLSWIGNGFLRSFFPPPADGTDVWKRAHSSPL